MHLEKVYEELRHSKYPVFIWGAGSMSVEVEKRLYEKGIHPAGRFIDTKIGQSHIIQNGGRILSLNEVKEIYPKIDVVMGHGHFEKASDMKSHSFINEVYVIANPYLQYKGPSLRMYMKTLQKLMISKSCLQMSAHVMFWKSISQPV